MGQIKIGSRLDLSSIYKEGVGMSPKELAKLRVALEACERKIFNACKETVKATTEAIYTLGQVEVFVDTGNLQRSSTYRIETGALNVFGYVWFGGMGDPINPISKNRASVYMWKPGTGPRSFRNWGGQYLIRAYDPMADVFDKMLAQKIRMELSE